MSTQDAITQALQSEFSPLHLEVVNESHMHSVKPGSASHFKVVIVSEAFTGKTLIARHRAVQAVVKMDALQLHALALHTYAPSEWEQEPQTQSPACQGGFGK